jgi:hypothetical protein
MSYGKINIIFPMAGDGIRFGGVFKPFKYAGEYRFIELAKERFRFLHQYFQVHYFYIFRSDQEETYNVTSILNNLFQDDKNTFCILNDKTSGPLQTVVRAIKQYNISGSSFICDCDLSINVSLSLEYLLSETTPDIIVSLYSI